MKMQTLVSIALGIIASAIVVSSYCLCVSAKIGDKILRDASDKKFGCNSENDGV